MFVFNSYSLHGQFDPNFISEITLSFRYLLKINKALQGRGDALGVDSDIAKKRECWPSMPLQEVLRDRLMGREYSELLLGWLDKDGPFLHRDVAPSHSSDCYMVIRCEKAQEVITDSLLGEAAFVFFKGRNAALVSLTPSHFTHSPIEVILDEMDLSVLLKNILQVEELQAGAESINSWKNLFDLLEDSSTPDNFPEVFELSTDFRSVEKYPLNPGVVRFLIDRLRELCTLWRVGERSFDVNSPLSRHFVDESDSNKNLFKDDFTFRRQDKTRLFCPYHAKFSYLHYRLHISWPIKPEEKVLLAYLGPKITKS